MLNFYSKLHSVVK